jgi:L-asparagine transporter-like permease
MYSVMFVVLSGSLANTLTFGKAVVIAATPAGTMVDPRLQKVFAIAITGVICQLQAFSRINYVRFNILFAIYKITLLTFLTVTGWCAMGGKRTASAAALGKPYGINNLKPDFQNTSLEPYGFALAMLSIMRVFLGYENANYVRWLDHKPSGPLLIHSACRFLKKFVALLTTNHVCTEDLPKSPSSG